MSRLLILTAAVLAIGVAPAAAATPQHLSSSPAVNPPPAVTIKQAKSVIARAWGRSVEHKVRVTGCHRLADGSVQCRDTVPLISCSNGKCERFFYHGVDRVTRSLRDESISGYVTGTLWVG